jgi:hypothetical protein
MKARLLLAVMTGWLLAAGCSHGSGPQSVARTASSAPPIAAVTTAPGSAATPAPTPASCKLAVASGDAPIDGRTADGSAGHGGFVQIPGGTFSADPASLGTYDRAVSRWLPVIRAAVSPDGTKYAWGDRPPVSGPVTGTIHVVDATTSADHPILVPAPSAVVSYESEGVYVTRVIPNSGAPPQGMVLVDPMAGTFHQIIADGTWAVIGGGFAFGQDVDPAVPLPSSAGPGAANRVRKLDLHTGAVTNVASYPGATVFVVGSSGATPLVGITTGSTYTVSMGASTVFSGGTGPAAPIGTVVVDGSTIWLGSQNGTVYRWQGSGPATSVATTSVSGLQVAGACR